MTMSSLVVQCLTTSALGLFALMYNPAPGAAQGGREDGPECDFCTPYCPEDLVLACSQVGCGTNNPNLQCLEEVCVGTDAVIYNLRLICRI